MTTMIKDYYEALEGAATKVKYQSTCIADHVGVFRGPFARFRNWMWWRRHDNCEEARRGDITDDFGSWWSKCDLPNCDLHVVRPGDARCDASFCKLGREWMSDKEARRG